MQKRVLGKTGETLTIIGFAGVNVTDKFNDVSQSDANAYVREAIDRGVNWFDVSPTYGNAEEQLGPALKEFRKDVFLACKTEKLDKESAAADLQASLKRLQTDYFDLYQFIHMDKPESLEKAMGPGGAIEAFLEEREKGTVRYLGFSAHYPKVALAMMDRFDFDSIMFPVNWIALNQADFGADVLTKAREKEMGILAIKAMALHGRKREEVADRVKRGGKFPRSWYEPVSDLELTDLAVRFTLSEPGVTAAVPTGDIRLFRRALDIADRFQPLTDEERNTLKERSIGIRSFFPFPKN